MALVVSQLGKEYPTRSGPLVVLRGLSLQIEPGENLAIMGPSGSGKSTLLYILGTLERPTSGTVMLDGLDPFSLAEAELAKFRNRRVGFVFQDHHLLPQCSVLENVLIPTLVHKPPDEARLDRARDLLGRVGLSARLDHRPAELSGGERQRVAVARSLINRPTLLLADEPTGNLDRSSAQNIVRLLLELAAVERAICITVTHSRELAARFDRRMELDEGKLREA